MTDKPLTSLCLLGHLSPRLITQAFVLAVSKEDMPEKAEG